MGKILTQITGSYKKYYSSIKVIDKPAGIFSKAKYKRIINPENPEPYYKFELVGIPDENRVSVEDFELLSRGEKMF